MVLEADQVRRLSARLRYSATLVSRAIVAGLLSLALLFGIFPFSSASATRLCTMACCAGKPPHLAGSCHMGFSIAVEAEPEMGCAEGEAEHHSDARSIEVSTPDMSMENSESPDHCDVAGNATDHARMPQIPDQLAAAVSTVLTSPCSSDCTAGAATSFLGRRQHDQAAVAYGSKPRPPTSVRFNGVLFGSFHFTSDFTSTYAPRGPPLVFA
jgi:hypothetical protein